jgi:hypothetical protein
MSPAKDYDFCACFARNVRDVTVRERCDLMGIYQAGWIGTLVGLPPFAHVAKSRSAERPIKSRTVQNVTKCGVGCGFRSKRELIVK